MNEIHFRLTKMVTSWHNSPAAHGMVCRQVLAAARNTQRVALCPACVGVCSSRRGSASMKK